MAESTHTIVIPQDEILDAIQDWLKKKYPGDARPFNIQLKAQMMTAPPPEFGIVTVESPIPSTNFSAIASRAL